MTIKISSALHYASISEKAYMPGLRSLPEGFINNPKTMDIHDKTTGFSGYAGFNPTSNEVIIAFAGTKSDFNKDGKLYDNLSDLLSDFKFITREQIPQLTLAKALTSAALKFVKELGGNVKDASITFTGHSLGAILSEIMIMESQKFGLANIHAVVFDSPGTLDYAQHHYKESITTQAHTLIDDVICKPNLINVFGLQLGKVHVLQDFEKNPILARLFEIAQGLATGTTPSSTIKELLQPHQLSYIIDGLLVYPEETVSDFKGWNNLKTPGALARVVKLIDSNFGIKPIADLFEGFVTGIGLGEAISELVESTLPADRRTHESLHNDACDLNLFGECI